MATQRMAMHRRIVVHKWWPLAVMLIGLMAVSTAAIFVRLAQDEGAPSLVIAAGRLCVATVILTPIVWRYHRDELRTLSASDIRWAMLSGAMLGLHFASWISSLEYTAVVNSVVLVSTNPLWVALLAPLFLRERLGRWTLLGLGLAFVGGLLVSLSGEAGDPPTRSDPWLGNSLALFGALMVAIYFMIGRSLRARLSLMVYVWLVYGAAAIILVGIVVITAQPLTGVPGTAYLWILMIGLVPQLIGHSSFNYALGFFAASYVSLIVLAEPVASGLLAIVILEEWPVGVQLIGAALVLVGIAVASREQQVNGAVDPAAVNPGTA